MNILKTAATAALALAAMTAAAGQARLGYCTDNLNRNNIFRMGSTETQGMAIRLDGAKLQALKGCSLSGISAAFGSSRTTGGTVDLYVALEPGGQPLAKASATITGAVRWIDFNLDTPYTITGDEPQLYIGYTAEISNKSSMLLADRTADSRGLTYIYRDGEWVDSYGLGYGSACIRAIVDDAPALTDIMIKPVAVEGYFKAGQEYALTAQLFNFGTTDVTALDLALKVGGSEVPVPAIDAAMAPNSVCDIALPPLVAAAGGNIDIEIEVIGVNGSADDVVSDNSFATSAYFYPADMERSLLIEGFTGMECSNCPAAHTLLEAFLESGSAPQTIEVMHHSGYQPDMLTMDADVDYTYFYGSPSTYAPAVMVNRTLFPTIGNVPVINVTTANLTEACNRAAAAQPYVSLSLETTYNPADRQVRIDLATLTHNDMPQGTTVLNVMLVQNGITGRQVPYGDGYTHNAVFRGVLTGNSWGIELPAESTVAGGTARWSTAFELPEYVFSDYWAYLGLTDEQKQVFSSHSVPQDMVVVAYVGGFDQTDLAGHTVYNAVASPLGSSTVQGGFTGLHTVVSAQAPTVRLTGRRIVVDGECDSLSVHTIDGRPAPADSDLAPGLYVVRAANGASVTVKKLLVR